MLEKNSKRVEVNIPGTMLDKINLLSEPSDKTIGEVIVRIIKNKFERDEIEEKNFRKKVKKGL